MVPSDVSVRLHAQLGSVSLYQQGGGGVKAPFLHWCVFDSSMVGLLLFSRCYSVPALNMMSSSA